jgi:hypothetical protein
VSEHVVGLPANQVYVELHTPGQRVGGDTVQDGQIAVSLVAGMNQDRVVIEGTAAQVLDVLHSAVRTARGGLSQQGRTILPEWFDSGKGLQGDAPLPVGKARFESWVPLEDAAGPT